MSRLSDHQHRRESLDRQELAPEAVAHDTFYGLDPPRIRQITGIRIHQLTLPDAIPLASKLVKEQTDESAPDGYFVEAPAGSSSRSVASPESVYAPLASPLSLRRQISSRSTHTHNRERSTSTSTITGSPIRVRATRPRAPTLAGEVLEHLHDSGPHGGDTQPGSANQGTIWELEQDETRFKKRRLARCFVVLKLPANSNTRVETRRRTISSDGVLTAPSVNGKASQTRVAKATKPFTSVPSPQPSDRRPRTDPSVSTSRSTKTIPPSSNGSRTRQIAQFKAPAPPSTPPSPELKRQASATGADRKGKGKMVMPPLPRNPSSLSRSSSDVGPGRPKLSPRSTTIGSQLGHPPRSQLNGNGISRSSTGSSSSASPPPPKHGPQPAAGPNIPFFISPIHPPSTYPRFTALESGDFAPWMTVQQSAGSELELEIWYEDEEDPDDGSNAHWKKLKDVSGGIDLRYLRRWHDGKSIPPNTIQFTLSTDPDAIFYMPAHSSSSEDPPSPKKRQTVKGVVERSMRETRMRKGVGVGALHQLINMQALIADTQRDIAEVQGKIDALLSLDADWRAMRRDINQRQNKTHWIESKVAEVGKLSEEVRATITLRRRELSARRDRLARAEKGDDHLRVKASELENEIDSVETERSAILPAIHHSRSQHVQTLDALFPITPIHPPSLLYAILNVPLPIPIGPKDPAPPPTLSISNLKLPPGIKVDERSTATALGYVAMVVQLLGNLAGFGSLAYPVTCAGSRSLVKDVVSVMQGPRSFPLYAKGVERYRYEYAVFLLNKNIEMLMQDANLRLLDLRHTLPNLKALLLTLSSPVPLPSLNRRSAAAGASHGNSSSHTTYTTSRTSSRQTSQAWSIPRGLRSPASVSVISSMGDVASPTKRRASGVGVAGSGMGMTLGIGTPSPLKVERRSAMASRAGGMRGSGDPDESIGRGGESEMEEESDVEGDGMESELGFASP